MECKTTRLISHAIETNFLKTIQYIIPNKKIRILNDSSNKKYSRYFREVITDPETAKEINLILNLITEIQKEYYYDLILGPESEKFFYNHDKIKLLTLKQLIERRRIMTDEKFIDCTKKEITDQYVNLLMLLYPKNNFNITPSLLNPKEDFLIGSDIKMAKYRGFVDYIKNQNGIDETEMAEYICNLPIKELQTAKYLSEREE